MSEQLAGLNKDFNKLVDVSLNDIFVSTSNIDTTSPNTWAKRDGKVLYLSIATPTLTASAWTRPAAVFKSPYNTVKPCQIPAVGYTGVADGKYIVEDDNGQRTFAYYCKTLSGGQNVMNALMTLLME